MSRNALEVFISYAHDDESLRAELEDHLKPLERDGEIRPWHDLKIAAGDDRRRQIDQRLEAADLILLLVSPSFLASDGCFDVEAKRALERHTQGQALVMPIIARPCDWASAPFAGLQALPTGGKPVVTWQDRDQAWLDVAEGLRAAIKPFRSRRRSPGTGGIWHVPHRRNLSFTGRVEVLAALREALTREGSAALGQAISGLGGIGKTQTAVEYAYRYRDRYQAVLWARAETEQQLAAGFAELAGVLDLPEKDAREQALAAEAVGRWLAEHDSWLLVLDNADSPEIVEPLVPAAPRGHVLLTSRAQSFGGLDVEPIRLATLPPDEALAFLLKRTGRQDPAAGERRAAGELAEELGFLPLALEQAAAYVADGSSFEDYLKSYRKRRLGLLAKGSPRRDYPESVATTWAMNFEQVAAASPASAEILQVSAFLAPDGIGLEILVEGATELGPVLAAALETASGDPAVLEDLLRPLSRFSLIGRVPEERTFSVHRMVQEVVKSALGEEARGLWAERCVRALNRVFPAPEFENWPRCERLSPHVKVLAREIDAQCVELEEAGRLLNLAGIYLDERGRYREALPLYQRSLRILEKMLGEEHPNVAASLNNLAMLHHDQGGYDQALPLYERSLRIWEKALGEEHPNVATSLENFARLLRKMEPSAERAAQIAEMEARAKAIRARLGSAD